MDGWVLIRALHLLAMGVFVGGQLVLAAAVVPAVRRHGTREAMGAAARRFGAVSALALATLVATGVAMASRYDRWGDGVLHAKLATLAVVLALTGAHVARPADRAVSLALLVGSLAIVWLGVDLAHG